MAAGFSDNSRSTLSGIALPASTFQMICIPDREFREGEIEALEKLFLEARVLLAQTSRYTGVAAAGSGAALPDGSRDTDATTIPGE